MAEPKLEITNKKINSYSFEADDFVAENEITVEITLSEYRKLVHDNAISRYQIDKLNSEKYKLSEEIKELNSKINFLKQNFANDVKVEVNANE